MLHFSSRLFGFRRSVFAGAPVLLFGFVLLAANPAGAVGYGLFQHGGRTTGQAGAFTARASDPSALTFNPAAIARLDGFQFQGGLDFQNDTDTFRTNTGSFDAGHVIQFPPAAYATWRPGKDSRWAFGLGLDAPFWTTLDWKPVFFPERFTQKKFELTVFQLHPVVAFRLSDGWSVGGGVRYLKGSLEQDDSKSFLVVTGPLHREVVEEQREGKSDVDGLGWDLALHYAGERWGWGGVVRSAVKLDGSGDARYRILDFQLPPADQALFRSGGSVSQKFELPAEFSTGIWFAPYPELRFEVDAVWQKWSDVSASTVRFGPGGLTLHDDSVSRFGNWDDTLSLRLGVEGDLNDQVSLFGGIAREESPVGGQAVSPGFPRGDGMVYAAGATYNFPQISFDLGYSIHQHDRNRAASGSYTARSSVWSASARWRFGKP
ncbi:MAG: outer membrane protein transport protein [Acidobacteriota bacterium]